MQEEGGQDVAAATEVRSAAWVTAAHERPLRVRISAEAATQLAELQLPTSCLFADASQLGDAITQCLEADPRPLYRWRRQQQTRQPDDYDLELGGVGVRCRFEADEASVTVLSIGSPATDEESETTKSYLL